MIMATPDRVNDMLASLPAGDRRQLQDFYIDRLREESNTHDNPTAEALAFLLLGEEIERRFEAAKVVAAGLPDRWATPIDDPDDAVLRELKDIIDGRWVNVPWPWPVLTPAARALEPGCVVTLCGSGGASKSFMILQASLHWLKLSIPFAIFHLEKDRKFHSRRALSQIEKNANLSNSDWIRDHPDESLDAYFRHKATLKALESQMWDAPAKDISIDELFKWVQERASEGRRIIVMDPVTAANTGNQPWNSDRKFVLDCSRVARESGATIIFVTHPRTLNSKSASQMDNHAGGQGYNRFTDVLISLEACNARTETIVERTPLGTTHSQATIDRVMHLKKVRSAWGRGWRIGFLFDSKTFHIKECGLLCDE